MSIQNLSNQQNFLDEILLSGAQVDEIDTGITSFMFKPRLASKELMYLIKTLKNESNAGINCTVFRSGANSVIRTLVMVKCLHFLISF